MRALFWAAFFTVSLGGCMTAPIPQDYTGPIATIRDSAISESGSRAQFYYLSQISGQRVDNILGKTRIANRGRGFSLTPVEFRRDLPARQSTLKIEARVGYGAPIQEILNTSTMYSVERTMTLDLESNKTYVVKGILTADKQEVWLEDEATGTRVE